MFSSKDLFFTPAATAAYTVSKSLRFRSSASAYLNRTFGSSPTSTTIYTTSFWMKRGALGAAMGLFGDNPSSNNGIILTSGNALSVYGGGAAVITTTAVFRDPSAWYHVVWSCNGTAQTVYINNVSVGTGTGSVSINGATQKNIGFYTGAYFDGYLAEFNFIDGQALTPSSFGAFDTNGVWQPAKYTGSYGTNGFYLPFSDNSALTTASNAGIGKDFSGNSNYWVTNNISITTGTTYDSMIDSPTNYADGGNGRGNYAVLNPLANNAGGAGTVSNANLGLSVSSAQMTYLRPSTIAITSGQWYVEAVINSDNTQQYSQFGIVQDAQVASSGSLASLSTTYGLSVSPSYANYATFQGSTVTQYGTRTTGAVTGQIAFDATNGKIWIGVNGSWLGGGNPSTGTTPTYSSVVIATWYFALFLGNISGANNSSINFGQQPFTYTPPSGFSALNTQNLPTPTIANGAQYMAAVTYQGNSGTKTVQTTSSNSGNNPLGTTFQPDFLWIKDRTSIGKNTLYNSLTGVTKQLFSDSTEAEQTSSTGVTSFNADGFTTGANPSPSGSTNSSPDNYIAWQWKAGGTGVSNTSGSITSTVSANTSAGFSVVTYTGNGTAGATVGHGLGVIPSMIIIKNRSAVSDWPVGFNLVLGAFPYTREVYLNSTAALTFGNSFNNTAPTSSAFYIGSTVTSNTNGNNYVAYCFAPVAGYSSAFSYTGNGATGTAGSADGPFVYLNFRPRFIILKRTDSTGDWVMIDTSRDTYNVANNGLLADTSGAESTGWYLDVLSNGFKIRTLGTASNMNASGGTYVGFAWAETPFKFSRSR